MWILFIFALSYFCSIAVITLPSVSEFVKETTNAVVEAVIGFNNILLNN